MFQCWFIIRRGCSHSFLQAGFMMKVSGLFFGWVVTGKPGRFLGWVCAKRGQMVDWGLSSLLCRRWGSSSPQHNCCSNVVGRVGMVTGGTGTLSPLKMIGTNIPLFKTHAFFWVVLTKNRNCLTWLVLFTLHMKKVTFPVLLESLELAWFRVYLEI